MGDEARRMVKLGVVWSLLVASAVVALVALDEIGGIGRLWAVVPDLSPPEPSAEVEVVHVEQVAEGAPAVPRGSLPGGVKVCGQEAPGELCVVLDWQELPTPSGDGPAEAPPSE